MGLVNSKLTSCRVFCCLASTERQGIDTAVDYKTRFRQYISTVNDRALYSLACVIDGNCPVNFRDQLKEGQI